MSRIYKQIDFAKQTWDFPLSNTKVQYVCGVLCVSYAHTAQTSTHAYSHEKKGLKKKKEIAIKREIYSFVKWTDLLEN